MKKLLFISKNLEVGGMEKALVTLLNALCDKYIINLILEEKKGELLTDLDSNINVVEYRLSKNKIVCLRKTINLCHKILWKLKNKNKYDFSCNYATYSLIGSYLARTASTNNALYVHSNYYEAFKHDKHVFKNFFDALAISEFKNILFVSNESMHSFISIYNYLGDKCQVINNLIEYKKILDLSQENIDIKFPKDKLNFIFVGRLDNDSKNFNRMLKSFSIALKQNKNINLYLVGDGKDKKLCEELIKKYKLSNNTFLLGEKINPYPYIDKCDVFLLTSNYEGYPVVLTESLVLNKPMISTISVSDSEINASDYITIVAKDEEEIAKAILNVKNETKNYNINFEKVNKKRLNALISIIED